MSYFCCTTQEYCWHIGEYYVEAVDLAEAVEMVEHVCGVELAPVDYESGICRTRLRNRALGYWQELIIELVPVDWDMTAEEISSSITAMGDGEGARRSLRTRIDNFSMTRDQR
jgi:hypothetical protein